LGAPLGSKSNDFELNDQLGLLRSCIAPGKIPADVQRLKCNHLYYAGHQTSLHVKAAYMQAMVDSTRKLKPDPISEAILEARFDTRALPEILLGHLADADVLKGFGPKRLPAADIPSPIRQANANLLYQASYQFDSPDSQRVAKVGEKVFSWHAMRPYPGWEIFSQELWTVLGSLFDVAGDLAITRLGLRYINLLNGEDHRVGSVNDLNLRVLVGDTELGPPLNINYQRKIGDACLATVRIASPEFTSGATVPFQALVDLDVFTPPGFSTNDLEAACDWVQFAHSHLKDEFFPILRHDTLAYLEEKA
jgi:uncharacterized protein (TIGR04255 family)